MVSSVRVFAGAPGREPLRPVFGSGPFHPHAAGAPAPARRVAPRPSVPRARPTRHRAADTWHPSTPPGSLVGACRRSRGSSPPCMNPRHRGRVLYGAFARRPRRLAFRGPRDPPLVTAVAAGATAPFGGSGESLAVGCAVDAPSPVRTFDPGCAVRRIASGDPYSTFCALLCASKHHCRVLFTSILRNGLDSSRAGARTIGTSRVYAGRYQVQAPRTRGHELGAGTYARGARVTMPNTSAGVGITFASGPLVPGWHMPSGQKSEKVSKKMATRQMPGASPHGTLLADDPWSSTERKQGRPSLPGEGVERPYGNYGKPVESSRRECRDGEGEVV